MKTELACLTHPSDHGNYVIVLCTIRARNQVPEWTYIYRSFEQLLRYGYILLGALHNSVP